MGSELEKGPENNKWQMAKQRVVEPLITWPLPIWNENGLPRSREESNTLPSGRLPVTSTRPITTWWQLLHYYYYYYHVTAPWTLSRTTQVSQYQKGETNLDLREQEIVNGSGISWAICKSAPRPRQITMPATQHSVFYRLDALLAAQPTASKHWRHY